MDWFWLVLLVDDADVFGAHFMIIHLDIIGFVNSSVCLTLIVDDGLLEIEGKPLNQWANLCWPYSVWQKPSVNLPRTCNMWDKYSIVKI